MKGERSTERLGGKLRYSWLVQVWKVHKLPSSKPGTFGERSKPMTIRLNSAPFFRCRCPRVADSNFAPGGRQYIGSHTDATDSTR